MEKEIRIPTAAVKAEFSLGLQEYNWIAQKVIHADFLYMSVARHLDLNHSLMEYHASLDSMFLTIARFLKKEIKENLNKKIIELRGRVIKWVQLKGNKRIPMQLIDDLRNLHLELNQLRQDMGIGIAVESKKSKKEILEGIWKQ